MVLDDIDVGWSEGKICKQKKFLPRVLTADEKNQYLSALDGAPVDDTWKVTLWHFENQKGVSVNNCV